MNRFLSRPLVFPLVALLLLGLAVPVAAQDEPIRTADYDVEALDFPPLRDFETPEPERLTLANGMTIFLLEDRELPQINAVARIGVGSVYEPADKVGLAAVTGAVMRTGGTASMSADSINQVLEGLGATVETSIGTTSGSAFMSTLKENVDTVLPIFAEVLRRPAFAAEKVTLAKNQQKSAIARRNDNAQQIAYREFDKLIYGNDSPYARHTEYWTIDAITREDVVAFHDQYVEPTNIILSVWGDFDAEAMKERLRAQFGDWTAPEGFTPPTPPDPTANRAHSVNFVQKDDVTQSTILMGHPGELRRDDADYPAAVIMNEVLSGGFSGRLFQTVRKEQGLAYAVFGNYSAGYDRPGRFFAGVFTRSGATVEAAQSVMHEVERMRQAPPTDEEVQLAKDSYLNSFVFNFDTKREVLSRLMTYAYYDYPADFLQQVRRGVEQVTTDDVLRVAQQYLHPDESHILVVGRQQDFSEDLSTLAQDGTVNEIDISIPTSPPGAAPAASAEDVAAGRELALAARDALGGRAFSEVENMRVVTQQQGNTSTLVVRLPNQLRTALNTPMGELTVVDDGEAMQLKTPQGTQTAPPQVRSQINSQLWRTLPYLMARLEHEELSFERRGEETIDGTTYQALRVQPPVGNAFTLYLDPESQRPQRLVFETVNPQTGQQVRVAQQFRDYQAVAGVMIPFKTVTTQSMGEQEQTLESTIQDIEINADLAADLFTLGTE